MACGLIVQEGDRYLPGTSRIFLGRDALMISKHHANWRLKALEAIERANPSDLHLSTVVSLAADDLALIKEQIIKGVERARKIIHASKEEELHCLNIDFFRVDRHRS